VKRSARYEAIVLDSKGRQSASLVRTAGAGRPASAAPRAAVGSGVPAARRLTTVSTTVFGQMLAGSSTSRSVLSRQDAVRRQPFAAEDTVRLSGPRFVVAYTRNNLQALPPTAENLPPTATFRSLAAATAALADWVVASPNLAGALHVLPAADASAPLVVPGGWSTGGALPAATAGTTAVRLGNGRLLVTGTTTALFDPVANRWTPAPATARRGHTTVLLADGRVLVAGGRTDTDVLASAELYDPVSNTWTATGSLSTARADHSATVLPNGKVLVAGGNGTRATLASTELYDPATGTWSAGAPMTEARAAHPAVLVAGRVLVVGGSMTTASLAYCELYDPAANTWAPTGNLATPRTGHQATRLPDGTVLVTGGDTVGTLPDGTYDARSLTTTERFNPTTGVWSAAAPMPGPRTRHRAIVLRTGRLLVTGGTGGPTFTTGFSSALTYDPATDRWTATSALRTGRWAHVVADLTDGRIVVAGGITTADLQPALTATTEIFTP
jgi:hypothetical protein